MMMISPTYIHTQIQTNDFDPLVALREMQLALSHQSSASAGAYASFIGTVRADTSTYSDDSISTLQALTLEHYPGMTERSLHELAQATLSDCGLLGITIIHRVGRLPLGDNIVLVIAAAPHRRSAFDALDYAMNHLKSDVPLWKREDFGTHQRWVQPPHHG